MAGFPRTRPPEGQPWSTSTASSIIFFDGTFNKSHHLSLPPALCVELGWLDGSFLVNIYVYNVVQKR